jgi:hypothetical protein
MSNTELSYLKTWSLFKWMANRYSKNRKIKNAGKAKAR